MKKSKTVFPLLIIISLFANLGQYNPVVAREVTWDIYESISTTFTSDVSVPAGIPKPYGVSVTAGATIKTKSPSNVIKEYNIEYIPQNGFSILMGFKEIGTYQIEETYSLNVYNEELGNRPAIRIDSWSYSNTKSQPVLFKLDDMYVDQYTFDVAPHDTIEVVSITPSIFRLETVGEIMIKTSRNIDAGEKLDLSITTTALLHKISSITPTTDFVAPVISHEYNPVIKAGDEIKAIVTDNVEVASVFLYFMHETQGSYKQIKMNPTGKKDEYAANIPIKAFEGNSRYYFSATDIFGNNTNNLSTPYNVYVNAIKFGDVNDDGKIDYGDALLVLENSVGATSFTDNQKIIGDVSGDGTISPYDAGLILRYFSGLILRFPVQDSTSSISDSYITASSVNLSIANLTGHKDGDLIVPITVSETGGLGIIGIKTTLKYDPNLLNFVDALLDNTIASGWLAAYKAIDDKIVFAMANPIPLDDQGRLVEFNFKISKNAIVNQVSNLIIDYASFNEGSISTKLTNGTIKIIKQVFQKAFNLYKGWNIFSLNYEIADNDILSVLKPLEGSWESVYSYTPASGWKKCIYNNPGNSNTLTTIDIGKGYLIYMKKDGVLNITGTEIDNRTISLRKGLNLVGYNSTISQYCQDALANLPVGTAIWGYNGMTKIWMSYTVGSPDFLDNLDQIDPGKGYYIYVDQNVNWTLSQ